MRMRSKRVRQFLWSLSGFVLLLGVLIAVDDRVHDAFQRFLWGADGIASWNTRAMQTWAATTAGLRYTSIEQGPLLAFVVVGVVLFVFMVRT